MRKHLMNGLALIVLLALAGCGSEERESVFPIEMVGENGLFRAVLTPRSEPLVVGSNVFELQVFAVESDAAAEGLLVAVEPWMPHHHHGSPSEPSVEELGEGRYLIRDVAFNMEGEWELRIRVTANKGLVQDRFVASFRV